MCSRSLAEAFLSATFVSRLIFSQEEKGPTPRKGVALQVLR